MTLTWQSLFYDLFQGTDQKKEDQEAKWRVLTQREMACPLPIHQYIHLIRMYIGSVVYYPLVSMPTGLSNEERETYNERKEHVSLLIE